MRKALTSVIAGAMLALFGGANSAVAAPPAGMYWTPWKTQCSYRKIDKINYYCAVYLYRIQYKNRMPAAQTQIVGAEVGIPAENGIIEGVQIQTHDGKNFRGKPFVHTVPSHRTVMTVQFPVTGQPWIPNTAGSKGPTAIIDVMTSIPDAGYGDYAEIRFGNNSVLK